MAEKRFTVVRAYGHGHRQGVTFHPAQEEMRDVSASTVRRWVRELHTYHNEHGCRVSDDVKAGGYALRTGGPVIKGAVRVVRAVHWNNGFENVQELRIVSNAVLCAVAG